MILILKIMILTSEIMILILKIMISILKSISCPTLNIRHLLLSIVIFLIRCNKILSKKYIYKMMKNNLNANFTIFSLHNCYGPSSYVIPHRIKNQIYMNIQENVQGTYKSVDTKSWLDTFYSTGKQIILLHKKTKIILTCSKMNWSTSSNGLPYMYLGKGSYLLGSRPPSTTVGFLLGRNP